MHEAKSQLSRLVERAEAGEEVIIGRAGKPVARLVAYQGEHPVRAPGRWKRKLWIATDFDATPDEILAAFEGDQA